MSPIVAIVGRPNVGKSTLFNRLIGTQKAIVVEEPGVTRDRNYGEVQWDEQVFTIIDTGGFEPVSQERLSLQIREQIQLAIDEADLILFVMDGRDGLTPSDREINAMLRSQEKSVIYCVNKVDGPRHEDKVFDFYGLGADRFLTVSAAHGYGVGELLDEMVRMLPETETAVDEERVRIAVVGRPNVGKSSWINRVLGQDRLLVDEQPGTTRDAIDTTFNIGSRKYRLIDTAGIRRQKKISRRLEKYSIVEALKSIDRCDVAVVLLDPFEKVTEQDARIGGFVHEKGKACVIAVNKWDLVKKDNRTVNRYTREIRDTLRYLNYAPIIFISALTGHRVKKTLDLIDGVVTEHRRRVSTGRLNAFLRRAITRVPPATSRGKRSKIYFATQPSTRPPTFVVFVNHPEMIHFSYERYLINQIRDEFGFEGTPIRIHFRRRA
jgi:GTP-binding protein